MIVNGLTLNCTEVCFANFISDGITTKAVINQPERKLANRTFVQCTVGRICKQGATKVKPLKFWILSTYIFLTETSMLGFHMFFKCRFREEKMKGFMKVLDKGLFSKSFLIMTSLYVRDRESFFAC